MVSIPRRLKQAQHKMFMVHNTVHTTQHVAAKHSSSAVVQSTAVDKAAYCLCCTECCILVMRISADRCNNLSPVKYLVKISATLSSVATLYKVTILLATTFCNQKLFVSTCFIPPAPRRISIPMVAFASRYMESTWDLMPGT